ncbi:MAG: hypothetical protein Q4G24_09185 [Paracoccus sp. (in: a-proteobacteria)]|uniref:hypothetical protein n=1 Tax=Paracoccus sp. TaxID=267 RepID=UPI0026DF24CB|nr:hypothetical protein [Paracoccus sp. (in: a-proteobacteria)]MDO5621628.1 hypothetical protein [Paracoccus sp. (in: a-proteobacteria)]
MTPRKMIRFVAAAAIAALPVSGAFAAIESAAWNNANPRGWSAVSGVDTRSVMESVRDQTAVAADQPYCDVTKAVEDTLRHDFTESFVSAGADDTQLWGSEQMGTWTLVMNRGDGTACIVASGVGYQTETSPQRYFALAGLR